MSQLVLRPRERAVEFLKAELANGPRRVCELETLAKKKGLSWRTVQRAKEVAYIRSERVGAGNPPIWQWYDPEQRSAATTSRPSSPTNAEKVWEEIFRLHKEKKEPSDSIYKVAILALLALLPTRLCWSPAFRRKKAPHWLKAELQQKHLTGPTASASKAPPRSPTRSALSLSCPKQSADLWPSMRNRRRTCCKSPPSGRPP